ncbi:MAG: hypothetical protein HY520_01265 [Candidatus Aenigmarchaeota archaeon]|nr:hypothetical protein [Candidatus Aenigmarchaeota archaeon]
MMAVLTGAGHASFLAGEGTKRQRGQLYSLIVILVVIPLLVFILGYQSFTQTTITNRGDKILADQMAQVAKNTEDDFIRAVQTAGRRALLAQVNHVLQTGQPVDNATLRMQELVLNGSLYGNASIVLFNNTLADWRTRILATPIGFERNISYGQLQVQNQDGFSIRLSLLLSINLSHPYTAATVARTVAKNVSISVEGLEDPLLVLQSAGNLQRKVYRHPYGADALLLFAGARQGNCSGTAVFAEQPGGSSVLVLANISGRSGYAGGVGETADLPGMGCYDVGTAGAVAAVNGSVLAANFSSLHLDEATGVWLLPLSGALTYYHTFPVSGPDFLGRLEGRVTGMANGLETFVPDATGITTKPGQSRVDYLYLANATTPGAGVRGFPSWFLLEAASAARYNVSGLQ